MTFARLAARLLALLLLISPVAGPARAADPIVIKFSHIVAPDTPKGMTADKFKQLAEAMTGGRVKVEVYPNSTLYKDGEELAALQRGDVQILAPSISRLALLGAHEFEVFDLPFLFKDYDAVHRVTGGDVGQKLLAGLAPYGLEGIAYLDNGFKDMSANRPLHGPADYQGLKMRIQPSAVLEAEMKALGATPVTLSLSEAYKALKAGTVDGTENAPSNLFTQRMHEVQTNLSVTNHGYLGYAVIVNKAFWDKLPPDIRAALEAAMQQATAYGNAVAAKQNRGALEKIRAAGTTVIYQPTPAELEALKTALLPVHKEMAGRIGQATIEAVYGAVGFQP
jgi:C4-dicarboxylate-binding protein DctP